MGFFLVVHLTSLRVLSGQLQHSGKLVMIMRIKSIEILLWDGYPLHQPRRELQKIQIVEAPLHPSQTVVSLSPLQNHTYPPRGISLVTIRSSSNPFILCHFLMSLLLGKPLILQLQVLPSLMLRLNKMLPGIGGVLAATLILQMFLAHLNLKHQVYQIYLQMDLDAACVKDFYHRDHLGVPDEL